MLNITYTKQKTPDYHKVFNVIDTCETVAQLRSAESYLFLFIKKHKITEDSPEWKYINILRLQIKNKFKTLICNACNQCKK